MSYWRQAGRPGCWVQFYFEMGCSDPDALKRLTKRTAPPCGTIACIAGWTVSLAYPEVVQTAKTECITWYGRAIAALNITEEQAQHLFYPNRWLEPFRSAYPKCKTQRQRARLVAKVINNFIKTYAS